MSSWLVEGDELQHKLRKRQTLTGICNAVQSFCNSEAFERLAETFNPNACRIINNDLYLMVGRSIAYVGRAGGPVVGSGAAAVTSTVYSLTIPDSLPMNRDNNRIE